MTAALFVMAVLSFVMGGLTGPLPLAVLHKPFRSLRIRVKYDILNTPEKFRLDFVIYLQHGWVYYRHVQTCLYCMIKECRVHGFTHRIVAAECK